MYMFGIVVLGLWFGVYVLEFFVIGDYGVDEIVEFVGMKFVV